MKSQNTVVLTLVKGTEDQYIIKDLMGITIGRIFIIELNKKNKFCLFRIKIYKYSESNYEYLYDTIQIMLKILFKNMNLKKVNIIIDEEMNIEPFIDLGIELEGFFQNNINDNGTQKSELLFGIDVLAYENGFFSRKVVLEGSNIELRILNPEYSEEMLDYCIRNKEHLKSFEPKRNENYYTLENQRKNLIDDYKNYLNGKSAPFGIFIDDELIGKIRISNIIMGVFKNGTIGYSIDEKYQGRGYMKEAVKLAIDYAFKEMDLHRIEASAMLENIKSQRVLKGCGFKELGINEKYLYINGEWKDHITFYKIKEY